MQIVIDANIIISILIKPGKPIEVVFNDNLKIFAPELLLKELENNKPTILEKSLLNKEDIDNLFEILKQRIKFIPEKDFISYREEALQICPDKKDVEYFALALKLKSPIWSNEKGLKKQNIIEVYATHELIKLLG